MQFEINAIIIINKYKSGERSKRDTWNRIADDVIIARKGKRNAILSLSGGVFEKGSLAKERNSYTFLSNLLRTALACSVLRLPHPKLARHSRARAACKVLPGPERFLAKWLTLVS